MFLIKIIKIISKCLTSFCSGNKNKNTKMKTIQ